MADKVQIMLELESRGALPADKKAILDELRSRGAIPSSANAPAEITNVPQGTDLVSKPTGAGISTPEGEPPRVLPIDWKDVGRRQVAALPQYGAAAGGALGALLAPETMGGSMVLAPGGYYAGAALRDMISPEQNPGFKEDLIRAITSAPENALAVNPNTIPNALDIAQNALSGNTLKRGVGAIGNMGQIPQKLASRMTGEPPNSEIVATALEKKIPLTKGTAEETTRSMANKAFAPAKSLVAEAEVSGKTVPKSALESAGQDALDSIEASTIGGANSPQYRKAARWLKLLENEPTNIPISRAESLKQGLNQEIRNWETAEAKDIAQAPIVATQKSVKRSLPPAIAEQTTNPEAYRAANQEYGQLAELMDRGGRKLSPAERADVNTAKAGTLQRVINRGKEVVGKPLYSMQKIGESVPEVKTPVDVSAIGGPNKTITPQEFALLRSLLQMKDEFKGKK